MKGRIYFIVIAVLFAFSCEEAFDADDTSADTDFLVVEGVLTNELKNHVITLSRTYPNQNGDPEPISGAIVTVVEGDSVFMLSETPTGSGNYYTPPFRAITGQAYELWISFDGREFFARDSSVAVESLQPLNVINDGDLYALELSPSGNDPNYINHEIRWNHTDACNNNDQCEGRIIYYDLKTIDVNDIYKPEKEELYFPENTIVIRTKYSISPAYGLFLRSMLMETQWRGSVFDVDRANVLTNLSEGAIGFFAVSTVVSDTTIVD